MVSGMASIEVMKEVKSIKDIDVKDKKVLIRVDFNVPMDDDQNITDDTRMREAMPTVNYCIDNGAKSVMLVSHLGRPKGERKPEFSLKHVQKRLERLLSKEVTFVENIEDAAGTMDKLSGNGGVALLENIRYYAGETKNDEALAKQLADACDVYVNDAFGTSHRAQLHARHGEIRQRESGRTAAQKRDRSFSKALSNPQKPMLLIVGGAKVSSKLSLLKNILNVVDKIIIGGAMSNTFLKAMGYNMQNSLVEDDLLTEAQQIMDAAKEAGVNLYLPVDFVCTDDLKETKVVKITTAQDIPEGMLAADIGPATNILFRSVVKECSTIIWNGPMGVFEHEKFARGTFHLAHNISDAYAYSVVGGGDTADAVDRAGEKDNMSLPPPEAGALSNSSKAKSSPHSKC